MRKLSALCILTVLVFSACGKESSGDSVSSRAPLAYTAMPPVATILETVGAGLWEVKSVGENGKDPHTFSLTPSIVSELSRAQLYVSLGTELDGMVRHRSLPHMEYVLVPTSEGGSTHGEEAAHGEKNDEASTGGHTHQIGGHDPHMWLDPEGILQIAAIAEEAFIRSDPAHEGEYRQALLNFSLAVNEADKKAGQILAPYKGARFYVQHGAFARFARHYGLVQVAMEQDEKSPGAARIAELIALVNEDGAGVIYAQPGHNPAPVKTIAYGAGARVEYLDPLRKDPLEALVTNAKVLAEGFVNTGQGADER